MTTTHATPPCTHHWYEPQHGQLICCDCGTNIHPQNNTQEKR